MLQRIDAHTQNEYALHKDNTPRRELQKWSNSTQRCRTPLFKTSSYYGCSFSISIITATGKPNTY